MTLPLDCIVITNAISITKYIPYVPVISADIRTLQGAAVLHARDPLAATSRPRDARCPKCGPPRPGYDSPGVNPHQRPPPSLEPQIGSFLYDEHCIVVAMEKQERGRVRLGGGGCLRVALRVGCCLVCAVCLRLATRKTGEPSGGDPRHSFE